MLFRSPEVAIKGGVADWRADLYALGVMTFEMLTGERPYNDRSPTKVIMAHLNAPIPSVSARRPDLRPEVDTFMQMALAKKPEDRSPHAQAFYESFAASPR